MSRVARYTTVILVTLTVLVLLWQIKLAVVLFLLSLVIAAAFRPAIDYLVDHRIPRNIALVLTYLLVIAAFDCYFIVQNIFTFTDHYNTPWGYIS
jgi:predicted PurR-regulated permease PerM